MSVIPYINIHTHHISSCKNNIAIYNQPIQKEQIEEDRISIGIHPWDIDSINCEKAIFRIKNMCEYESVKVIGEIGLDKMIDADFERQKTIFLQQLTIAEENQLPIIVHCVKAFSELLQIRKETEGKMPWIIHGYRKNVQLAKNLIDANCYLSFGDALIRNKKLQESFQAIPLNAVFFETDESSISIEEIYKCAAQLKEIKLKKLTSIIEQNYKKIIRK